MRLKGKSEPLSKRDLLWRFQIAGLGAAHPSLISFFGGQRDFYPGNLSLLLRILRPAAASPDCATERVSGPPKWLDSGPARRHMPFSIPGAVSIRGSQRKLPSFDWQAPVLELLGIGGRGRWGIRVRDLPCFPILRPRNCYSKNDL